MSPRRRSTAIKIPNLYERKGYYSWRNPLTREEFGLGRDKVRAIAEAVEANLHIASASLKQSGVRLVDRLTGNSGRTLGQWNEKYQGMLAKQDYAPISLRQYKSLGNRLVRMLGAETPLQSVLALQVSEMLETVAVTEGKARTAQVLRVFARDSFREARVQGWYVGENPVLDTRLPIGVETKRARLTWESLEQIRGRIDLDWLRNAIDLALVSGQRRDDVAHARFRDFHDGAWWLQQRSKKSETPHRIVIPLELRLDRLGKSLGDVLTQCRRTGVASPHLVHQTTRRGSSPVGSRMNLNTVTRRFSDAVKRSGIDWGQKEPPTFHELRSLSERLYAAQGGVNTQELLGHTDARTTGIYHDSRGAEWIRIQIK